MALNYMRTVAVTRGGGASVMRGAAYRSGSRMVEQTLNAAAYRSGATIKGSEVVHDYSRKTGVIHSEVMAPAHAPERLLDRQTLWTEADRIETRKNSQVARDWLFPLPAELTAEQSIAMIREHIRERFVARGMVAQLDVHEPSWKSQQTDSPNLHAHVMTTTRDIQADGTWGPKTADSVSRAWQGPAFVQAERHAWQDRQNATFARLGLDVRVRDGAPRLSPEALAERLAADRERAEAFGAAVPELAARAERERTKQQQRSAPRSARELAGRIRELDRAIAEIQERRRRDASMATGSVGSVAAWVRDPAKAALRAWESMDRAAALRRRHREIMRPATREEAAELRWLRGERGRAERELDGVHRERHQAKTTSKGRGSSRQEADMEMDR